MNTRYERYANGIAGFIRRNRRLIILCLISTFVWGLFAHSSVFLQNLFTHDALNEFNADIFGNDWKIQLGRIFVPAYHYIVRGSTVSPWLNGLLSLLYISFAVFLTVKIFDIHSPVLTILISGIYAVNRAYIATAASFTQDLDCNMFAFALTVLSVYLWNRSDKGYLLGIIPLCLAIGLYQGFISVAITLIILCLVMRLLNGERFGNAFRQGLKSVAMILAAGVLYFIALKLVCKVTGISIHSGSYNSLDTVLSMSVPEIIRTMIKGYIWTCRRILTTSSVFPKMLVVAVHAILILISAAIVLCRLFQKEIGIKERILTLVLIALLPLGMNIIYPLTGGMSHDVMEFSFWLCYLFVLLLAWWAIAHFDAMRPLFKFGQRIVSVCLICLVLWGNVRTANMAYLKKDLEQRASFSMFTRIVCRMESMEGYVLGETPVVFYGAPVQMLETAPGFEKLTDMFGCQYPYALYSLGRERYCAYFDYILLNPAKMADPEIWSQMQSDSRIAAMPSYPEEGCMAFLDGVLVVKLGEQPPRKNSES